MTITESKETIVAALLAKPLLARYVERERERLAIVHPNSRGPETTRVEGLEAEYAAEGAVRAIRAKVEKLGFRRSDDDYTVFLRRENGRWRKYSAEQVAHAVTSATR